MISLENPCPVCRQSESRLFHQTVYPEHGYPGTFSMRQCAGCGLLFNAPRLGERELAALYGRSYYFFLRKDSRELRRIVAMYQRTIGLIQTTIPTKRSIDIGCGRGYFPAILKRLGWDASGIEISPEAAEGARSNFGLEVFTGTVEEYAASSQAKTFSVVTAIDVIEHVPSPDAFVESAARLVEPGGRLIIDTPNAAAQNIVIKGTSWKGFNPFHIYLFTIDTLTALLARHGMMVDLSISYGNVYTPIDLRDSVLHGLKRTGLLGQAARSFLALKKLTISNSNPEPHIESAVSRIMSGPPYTQTPDSQAPLSATKTGDNIVVIARRSDSVL